MDTQSKDLEKYYLTLEALEDVKANRVVDHAKVQAWANSLPRKNSSKSVDLFLTNAESFGHMIEK